MSGKKTKTCKNCAFFNKDEKEDIRGGCGLSEITTPFDDKENPFNDIISAYSDWGEGCYICVGINFGCIHYKEK